MVGTCHPGPPSTNPQLRQDLLTSSEGTFRALTSINQSQGLMGSLFGYLGNSGVGGRGEGGRGLQASWIQRRISG